MDMWARFAAGVGEVWLGQKRQRVDGGCGSCWVSAGGCVSLVDDFESVILSSSESMSWDTARVFRMCTRVSCCVFLDRGVPASLLLFCIASKSCSVSAGFPNIRCLRLYILFIMSVSPTTHTASFMRCGDLTARIVAYVHAEARYL